MRVEGMRTKLTMKSFGVRVKGYGLGKGIATISLLPCDTHRGTSLIRNTSPPYGHHMALNIVLL